MLAHASHQARNAYNIVAIRQNARALRRLSSGTKFRASLRAGILGGSFNPAHSGHAAIADNAIDRLALGRVLWVVARCPPMKNKNLLQTFETRLESARSIAAAKNKRANSVANLEQQFNITYSCELTLALTKAFPEINLVFLLGADNFARLTRWRAWREVAKNMPLAVFPRKERSLRARLSLGARAMPHVKHCRHATARIAHASPPRWAFVAMQNIPISSSDMRKTLNAENL